MNHPRYTKEEVTEMIEYLIKEEGFRQTKLSQSRGVSMYHVEGWIMVKEE